MKSNLPNDEVVSRAYATTRADDDAPPSALDDAIRAAARRAVHARPQPIGKSWLTRYRIPLSMAAVMMLTSSLVLVSVRERPSLELDAPRVETAKKKTEGLATDTVSASAEQSKPPTLREDVVGESARTPRPTAATSVTDSPARERTLIPAPPASPAAASSPQTQAPTERRISANAAPAAAPAPPPALLDTPPAFMPGIVAPSARPAAPIAAAPIAPAPPAAPIPLVASVAAPSPPPAAAAPAPLARVLASPAPAFAKSAPSASESTSASASEAAVSNIAAALPSMGTARSKQDKPTQTAMLPANNVARSESLAATADISAVLAKNRNGPEPTFRTTAALWIEHLTSLQRAGKTSELGHELTRFRERHPRAELPEALREIETRMKAAPQKFSDSNPPG